ncbi:hypothetical protein [Actinomadura formosensis]|uniref:hypothetical protein n=1 Tax=Actinomadura formosensis TaxID=60706 RepID=UPI003D8CA895
MELWSVVRPVRAAMFATTCTGLAAGGHLAAGGTVEPLILVACFVMMFVPALALTHREHSIVTILPAVASCQVVLHLVLSRCCVMHGMSTAPDTVAAHGALPGEMAAHGMPAEADGSPGFSMLLMHAVAVLVTSWWLERGEAALCAFVSCVASWALRSLVWLRPAAAHGPARPRPVLWARHPLPAQVLQHVMVRRGPPAVTGTLVSV